MVFFTPILLAIIISIGLVAYLIATLTFNKLICHIGEWMSNKPRLKRFNRILFYLTIISVSLLSLYVGYGYFIHEFDAYKGVVHNKFSFFGLLTWFFYYCFSLSMSVLIVVLALLFRVRKLKLSFIPLIINILIVIIPLIRFVIPSYDSFMIKKAKKVVAMQEFKKLRNVFSKQDSIHAIGILPNKSVVFINDHVINLDTISSGPIPKFLGMIGMYYDNSDSVKYSSFEELFREIGEPIDSVSFFNLYDRMLKIGINEIRNQKNCKLLNEYFFHSTGMAGERAIAEVMENCNDIIESDSIVVKEELEKGLYYVYRKGWQPF